MPLARRTASKDNMPAKASDPPFAQDLKLKNRHRSVAPEKTEATRPPPDSEIIVIDDSDDENPPLKRKRALSRTNSKGRAKSSLEDVVEITSGPDDHSSRSHEKTIKNLQEQVQSLRQANTRLQNRLAYGREESGSKDAKIAQLTADIASMKKTSNNVRFSFSHENFILI
ncbi:hypothetical protein OE88DRAFT_1694967 [Heliocybe sulcata]|uniref:Uncharacterized protein n=1 Tax=Heliocybe sulcata TaxID=5364 RepID=A0A5C3NA67_9AGAM|nr:hypothetical protein OE88DRAFT_1694967 [Heliocybe sulcata]